MNLMEPTPEGLKFLDNFRDNFRVTGHGAQVPHGPRIQDYSQFVELFGWFMVKPFVMVNGERSIIFCCNILRSSFSRRFHVYGMFQ